MKVTKSNTQGLTSIISVEVEEKDYLDKVNNVLKDYRKTAQVPGFRKGKTPIEIINKKYRKSILIDEVNKLIQAELYQYIKSEKIQLLGSPMPVDDSSIDWDNSTGFNFQYEVGLAPNFNVNITSKDRLDYYKINVDDKLIDSYCADIARRYGKMSNPEISITGDLIFCSIEQLDANGVLLEDGIKNDATVSMDHIADSKIRKQLIGLKSGDVVTINVLKAFENHSDLAAMLAIKNEEINDLVFSDFHFTVKNINRLEPADLNVELFNKVYGPGLVKNKKEFRAKVKSEAEAQFVVESDRMLKNDVVNYLLDKLQLNMPDDFLKKWLIQTSEQPITMDMLNKDYDTYVKSLQWQLIENKILEDHNIKVTDEEVVEHAKTLIRMQMKQYGQPEGDEAQMSEIASNILKNDKEKRRVYDQIFDQKTMIVYKENFKLKEKSVSYDDFVKLASEKK